MRHGASSRPGTDVSGRLSFLGMPVEGSEHWLPVPPQLLPGHALVGFPQFEDTEDLLSSAKQEPQRTGQPPVALRLDGEVPWVKLCSNGLLQVRPGIAVSHEAAASLGESCFLSPVGHPSHGDTAVVGKTDLPEPAGLYGGHVDTRGVVSFEMAWLKGYRGSLQRESPSDALLWRQHRALVRAQFPDPPVHPPAFPYRQGAIVDVWLRQGHPPVPSLIISGNRMNGDAACYRHYILQSIDNDADTSYPELLYELSPAESGLPQPRTIHYMLLRSVSRARFRGRAPYGWLSRDALLYILQRFRRFLS